MINYIVKKPDNKLYISKGNDYLVRDISLKSLLDELLLKELATLHAREKTLKKLFKFKSKIPVVIDDRHLLMSIRSHRAENSLYINYFSIYKHEIKDNDVLISFHNGHVMKISEKYTFFEQLDRCRKIIEHLMQ